MKEKNYRFTKAKNTRKNLTCFLGLILVLILAFFVTGCDPALSVAAVAAGATVQKQAQKTQTATTMQNISLALKAYREDMGEYPQTNDSKEISNALTGFVDAPNQKSDKYYKNPNWRGPYYTTDKKYYYHKQNNQAIVDAWGNPINFNILNPKYNPYKFDIWSNGPDGKNDNGLGDDVRP